MDDEILDPDRIINTLFNMRNNVSTIVEKVKLEALLYLMIKEKNRE